MLIIGSPSKKDNIFGTIISEPLTILRFVLYVTAVFVFIFSLSSSYSGSSSDKQEKRMSSSDDDDDDVNIDADFNAVSLLLP